MNLIRHKIGNVIEKYLRDPVALTIGDVLTFPLIEFNRRPNTGYPNVEENLIA